MRVEFARTFSEDLKKVRDKALLKRVKDLIERVEQSPSWSEIPNLKRLKGDRKYSRIRLGDYRIGILLKTDAVTFVRFLNRKDVYKYFP